VGVSCSEAGRRQGSRKGTRVRRLLSHLGARWQAFAHDADALRAASSAISVAIKSRDTSDDRPMASLPRLTLPIDGRMTSAYGLRQGRLHEGIDIAGPVGTPVPPVLAGIVVLADELPVYGRVIVVDHGRNLASVYAHLARIDVAVGEHVERTQQLGTVGTSGRSFGPHLHFEVRLDGTAVDPQAFLD
jgi:murein DD-endopeptidase MepM/ murein hydrolase activator NlpD